MLATAEMLAAILWDHDGVLVDTERLYFQANREQLARVGVDLTPDLYRQLLLVDNRGAWHLAEERGVSRERIDALRAERDRRYQEALTQGNVLVPNALEVLARLGPHYRMAVVTSSKRQHFGAIHQKTALRSLVEFVLVREDYQRSKPDPEPYRMALTRLGLSPEQCLVVEDSQRGLMAAHAAGLRCWIVRTELTQGLDFSAAEQCFDNLGQVENALMQEPRPRDGC